MKVSLDWLKEHVAIRVSPQALAEKLTMAGLEVGALEAVDGDVVFDIEITANRADCLSVLGIAQEAAAVLGTRLRRKQHKHAVKMQKNKTMRLAPRFISIQDKKGCLFYRCCLLTNVTVGASPAWLKKRIEAAGARSVNTIVDITNYCLLEFGQPLHAFDYDKLVGGIAVRRAKQNEKILTIDGVERALSRDILLIADKNKAVAIAGVMGDKLSEVGMATKNIFLESAYFDPVLIRRASRALGISTESSYRFERGVDGGRVIEAQDRAVALMSELAGAQLVGIQTCGKRPLQNRSRIAFRCRRANEILSLGLRRADMKRIFGRLGFRAQDAKDNTLLVEVPTLRRDIAREEDLIEECARIHGYDKIPSTMPAIRSRPIENSAAEQLKQPVREILCSLGFDEIITYSLIGKDLLDENSCSEAPRLRNPLSSEQEYLRSTLINSALQCLAYNMNRANKNLRFFEISHVFDTAYHETMSLAIMATGARIDDWKVKQEMDFFALKGTIEALCQRLGISGIQLSPLAAPSAFHEHESARIAYLNTTVGVFGRVNNSLLVRFGIKHAPAVFYAEIALAALSSLRKDTQRFVPLSIYPSVARDMSLIAKDGIRYEAIANTIQAAAGPSLKKITLIDLYRGEQIPKGRMSVTVSLAFGLEERTLSDQEINALLSRITQQLKADLAIDVRG